MDFHMHSINAIGNDSTRIVVKDIAHKNSYDFSVTHRHDYFEILLFEKGDGGKHLIDFTEYKIATHNLFLIGLGQVHLLKRKPTENGILIQFSLEFLEISLLPYQINWFYIFQANPQITLSNQQFENLFAHFKEIKKIYDENSNHKCEKLQKLFALLFFEIIEFTEEGVQLKKSNDVSYKFMILVLDTFKETRIVSHYSKLLNVPINKLVHEVKIHFGKSPLEIINKILLVEVKRLLVVERMSHKEIAYALNFDSQASYSRFIKAHTQKTPTDLKKYLATNNIEQL